MDRKLIGAVVEREMRRNPELGTWPALDRRSGVSRAVLYRIRNGAPNISSGTLHRVEAGLSLPTDTLVTIGEHDFHVLAELGVPTELINWVQREATKSAPGDAVTGT